MFPFYFHRFCHLEIIWKISRGELFRREELCDEFFLNIHGMLRWKLSVDSRNNEILQEDVRKCKLLAIIPI